MDDDPFIIIKSTRTSSNCYNENSSYRREGSPSVSNESNNVMLGKGNKRDDRNNSRWSNSNNNSNRGLVNGYNKKTNSSKNSSYTQQRQ